MVCEESYRISIIRWTHMRDLIYLWGNILMNLPIPAAVDLMINHMLFHRMRPSIVYHFKIFMLPPSGWLKPKKYPDTKMV